MSDSAYTYYYRLVYILTNRGIFSFSNLSPISRFSPKGVTLIAVLRVENQERRRARDAGQAVTDSKLRFDATPR
jgi:hypothetical protein